MMLMMNTTLCVPVQVDGSLRFSVFCDQMQSRLVVTVLQVEGLSEHNQGRSLQPFVKILLMWAGSEAVETEGFNNDEASWSFHPFTEK